MKVKYISLIILLMSILTCSATYADVAKQSSISTSSSVKYNQENFSIESNAHQLWLISKGRRISFEQLLKLPKLTLPKIDSSDKKNISLGKLSSSRSIELLSIFDIYCSVRVISIYSTGTRPYGDASFKVFDSNTPSKQIRLTNFFSDTEIVQAFANAKDDVLQEAGKRALDDGGKAKDITALGLSKRFLSEFAIYDLDDEYVTVAFVIGSGGHGDGLDRDDFYTIKLKTPTKWKASLVFAKQLKAGFLVSNRKEMKSLRPVTQSLP